MNYISNRNSYFDVKSGDIKSKIDHEQTLYGGLLSTGS